MTIIDQKMLNKCENKGVFMTSKEKKSNYITCKQ